MSHYSKVRTKLKSLKYLTLALQDMEFKKEQIQYDKVAQQLEGYHGDKREQTAELVIPRRFIGKYSNDIGFKLQQDGTWEAIISDYDKSKYNSAWLGKLYQRYAYKKTKDQLADNGFLIESEIEENGELFLNCTRDY